MTVSPIRELVVYGDMLEPERSRRLRSSRRQSVRAGRQPTVGPPCCDSIATTYRLLISLGGADAAYTLSDMPYDDGDAHARGVCLVTELALALVRAQIGHTMDDIVRALSLHMALAANEKGR